MANDPLDYRKPSTQMPPTKPVSFKYSSFDSKDDFPVTVIKWAIFIAFVGWIVAILIASFV